MEAFFDSAPVMFLEFVMMCIQYSMSKYLVIALVILFLASIVLALSPFVCIVLYYACLGYADILRRHYHLRGLNKVYEVQFGPHHEWLQEANEIVAFNCISQAFSNLISFQARYLYGYTVESYTSRLVEEWRGRNRKLFAFYSSPMPLDVIFFANHLNRQAHITNYACITVGANVERFLQLLGLPIDDYIFHGPFPKCRRKLEQGCPVIFMPGGQNEAFEPQDRDVVFWPPQVVGGTLCEHRFARMAVATRAEVVPVYTTNVRQAIFVPSWVQNLARGMMRNNQMPLFLFFGGLPVSLTTHLGPAIAVGRLDTPKDISIETQDEMRRLLIEYRPRSASILSAILQRLRSLFR